MDDCILLLRVCVYMYMCVYVCVWVRVCCWMAARETEVKTDMNSILQSFSLQITAETDF